MNRSLEIYPRLYLIDYSISEPYQVQSIDIGNDGSAFVEILARRAEQAYNLSTDDDGFRTLLPAASFLTPMESRNEENISRVRMFGQEKLSKDLSSQKWDQFKVLLYTL